jgi:signal transduction histidine kinase
MMQHKNIIVKLIATLILFSYSITVNAQQSRVDSAIALLNKSNTPKGFDTVTFYAARQLISTAVLSDGQITQIEKAAEQFKKGKDEDLCYAVMHSVLVSLAVYDKYKAIDYAKERIAELEKSSTPNAHYLAQVFLGSMRLPYRNSDKITEGFQYYTEKLNHYKRTKDSLGLTNCYYVLGGFYRTIGLYEPAIYNMKKSISYIDSTDIAGYRYLDFTVLIGKTGWINNAFVVTEYYTQNGEYEKAITQGKRMLKESVDYYNAVGKDNITTGTNILFGARHLAYAKILANQLDSVDYYITLAESAYQTSAQGFGARAVMLQFRAFYNIKKGAYGAADSLLQLCSNLVSQYQIPVAPAAGYVEPDYYLALLRIEQKNYQEAMAALVRNIKRVKGLRQNVLRDYKLLAGLYEKTGDNVKAKEVYKNFIILQDSALADQSKFRTISFETEQQITDNEIAISKLESANKLSAQSRNFSIGIAALLLILAGSIYYRFQSKKKANAVLEKTLTELKSTQSQLIQSEKMASLGELTAGIAHEIQNPLNFVNNFSEVNTELIEEMKEELKAGKTAEAISLADDIKANNEKIAFHGKRADSIVKGMLQHSRSGSNQKEATDINNLLDECLRLSFHGMRAKDKSFNAKTETSFDSNLIPINIVSQEIGRVFLNLFTNAFYSVMQKKKELGENYNPVVSASTQKEGNAVKIIVRDNGNGIPQRVIDKIFQPFFTTKPTGEGTGLGLSMSYDIITKGHGGELKVETREGEFAQFTIILPL